MSNKKAYVPFTVDVNNVEEIQEHYAKILDQAALNVADPLAANIGYFNNSQKVIVDPQKVGKTVVFMTRPNLNLRRYKNIKNARMLRYLASNKLGITVMRYLMYGPTANNLVYGSYPQSFDVNIPKSFKQKVPILGTTDDSIIGGEVITDRSYAMLKTNFIPMITNLCTNVSNAKDITVDTFETDGNFSGDKLTYAMGIDENFSIGEISLTFEDIYSSPIMILFLTWIMYMHYVGKGLCDPEWTYIVNRIIDYTSSLYVFVLGTDQETILRWTKYTGLFPRSFPFGSIMHSVEIDKEILSNITIPCAYNFSNPMDPVVLSEFNMLSGPTLYNRFVTAKYREGKEHWKGDLVRALNGHYMSYKNALTIREVCPPTVVGEYPEKALEGSGKYAKEISSNFDGSIDKYSAARLSLMNRQSDHIENNWAGVPYIVEGNKLMWL